MENTQLYAWKYAGTLMLAGGIIFWIGAWYPPYRQWMTSDVNEYLSIINANQINWYIIHGCFAIGVIVTIFGIQLLADALILSQSNRILSNIAYTAFLTGSIFWLLNIAFRLTVTMWAAKKLALTGELHDTFKTWMDWSNLLFAFYMILAYLATGCLGVAMKEITWLPVWVSWFFIIFGFGGIIGYITRIPIWVPPLMVHLPFIIGGIVILLKLTKA